MIRTARVAEDITERKRQEKIAAAEKQILELIARNSPIADVLDSLCRVFEKQFFKGASFSILLLDSDGVHMRHGAAPSLPERYIRAIDGFTIGPAVGSCGTAAFFGKPIIVTDIANDPLWRNFRDVALRDGLRSCWSTPIFSDKGKVVGTFATYYRDLRAPTEEELQIIEHASHLASIRIAREENERALHETESILRKMIDGLGANMFVGLMTPDGTLIEANESALAAAGLKREDVLGKPFEQTYWWAHSESVQEKLRAAIRQAAAGTPVRYDTELRVGDGSFIWIDFSLQPLLDDAGRVVYLVPSGMVINERKHAEQKLRESEAQYRNLIEQASDGIFITDAQGNYQLVNSRACALLGFAESEMIGMHGSMTHLEDDLETYAGRLQSVVGGKVLRYERMMKRKDGSVFPADVSAKKLGDDEVQFIFRDITERKQAEALLRESETRFRSFVEQSPDAMIIHRGGRIDFANDAMVRLMRAGDTGTLLGKPATSLVHAGNVAVAEQRIARLYSGQPQPLSEQVYVRADGTTVDVEVAASPFVLDGKPAALVTVREITGRKEQERRIARLSRIQAVLSGINSAIVRIRDRQELFEEACRIAVEHGGFSIGWIAVLDQASGKLMAVAQAGLPENLGAGSDFFNGSVGLAPAGAAVVVLREKHSAIDNVIEDAPGVVDAEHETDSLKVRRAAIGLGAKSVIVLPLIVEGQMFGILTLYATERNFFDEQEIKLLDELAGDISFGLEFIAKQEKVDYLAYYDTLTGLPNRSLFFDRLTHQLGSAAREGSNVALLLIDLDRFRQVNSTLGRQAGDALLQAVAERLNSTIRDRDSLARIGSNRFALAVSGISGSPEAAHALESRNREWFERPFTLGGEELRISATAGIAMFPDDAENAEALFANAEAALRLAKGQSTRFLFYGPEMNARVSESLRLESRLRRAIANHELTLWYQPKIDLRTGKITGMEALMRWRDPESGLVPPGQFIPIMEQTGMILDAGSWALSQVAVDCRLWISHGLKPPRVAVNVSPIQLRQKDFVARVVEAADETQAADGALDLEITESVIMENVDAIIPKLQTVRSLGVEIFVDDFGTGYSSLAYIARLPIHSLKIDRSFIVGMTQNEENLNIVNSMISLAHTLKLRVVAEGVETEAQAALLRHLECDEMQGFLFSPAVPPEEVPALLR